MGVASSIIVNKTIFVSYDSNCENYKIQDFIIKIQKLPISIIYNDITRLDESDIIINLITNNSTRNYNQQQIINRGENIKSIFIYIDSYAPMNNNLSCHKKSIYISYSETCKTETLLQIILAKLQD